MPLVCQACHCEPTIGEKQTHRPTGTMYASVKCDCGRSGEVLIDERTGYYTVPSPEFVWEVPA